MLNQALQLRPTFDKKKQSQNIEDSISFRHKGYLKEMLVNKFLVKNQLDSILVSQDTQNNQDDVKFKNHQNYIKVQFIVKQEFDKFINEKQFSQKNLIEFEMELIQKVNELMQKEGIEMIQNKNPNILSQQRSFSQQKLSITQPYKSRQQIQIQQPQSSSRIKPSTAFLQIEVNQKVNSLNKRIENIKSANLNQKISLPTIKNSRYNQDENTYTEREYSNKINKQQKVNRSHLLQKIMGLKKKNSSGNIANYPLDNDNEDKNQYFNNKIGKNKSFVNIFNNKFKNNEFISQMKEKQQQNAIDNNQSQNLEKCNQNLGFFKTSSKSTYLNHDTIINKQENQNNLSSINLEKLNGQLTEKNDKKQFADIRVKMGEVRSPSKFHNELDSIPSELSEDMWGEVPKFNFLKHQEQLKKQKDDIIQKKQIVKMSLDEQIVQQKEKKLLEIQKIQQIDQLMLKKAKEELNEEKLQKEKLKLKIIQQKEQRDQMLKEANQNKKEEFQNQRKNEIIQVEELQKQLQQEKKEKIEKKNQQREQAWKVIKENEIEKERRMKQKEEDKIQQNKIMENYNKLMDDKEKKRAQEWADREARIQNAMGRMAETVVKKSNEAEKAQELKLLENANKIDKEAEERDKKKKEEAKQREIERKKVLDLQMMEKKLSKQQELEENKKYVQMVLDRDEQDRKEQKNKEIETFKKLQEIQKFQKLQMGEFVVESQQNPSVDGAGGGEYFSISSKIKKKNKVGGPMNIEEIRMNKDLLRQISQLKKNQNGGSFKKEQSPSAVASNI